MGIYEKKQTKNGGYLYRNLCSGVIIAAIFLFLFFLRYDVPLYGDDIGGLVANNPDSTYIDDRVIEGECTLDLDYSVSSTWSKITYMYFMWNGRVTAKFVTPLIRIIFSLPDGVSWVLFSLYIAAFLLVLLLLTAQIVCGSIKEVMRSPAAILLTGILLFYIPSYSYAYMTRLIMYTFTNIYVVSVILYLSFYGAIQRVFERSMDSLWFPSVMVLIAINLLGLLAGLSHEAYGVVFGMVLLTQLIRYWLENHRRISIRYLFMYFGYIVGFCICFFAPGNFNRAGQSHESALHTVPLLTRLLNSFYIHAYVVYKIWIVPAVALPVLVGLIVILLRKKILTVKAMLSAAINNLEWFLGFAMSAVTWGLVARVMNYGMLAANVILIIGVIRVLRELWMTVAGRVMTREGQRERVRNVYAGISIAVVIVLAVGNYTDMAAVHRVADEWRENIRLARKIGMEEITVPAYPEDLDARFYDLNAINSQSRYDKVACRVVYGTHVLLEEMDE